MNLKKRTAVVPCAVISALRDYSSLAAAQDTQHQQSSATSNGPRTNHPGRVANGGHPAQLSNGRRDPDSFGPVHVQPGRHHVGIWHRSRFESGPAQSRPRSVAARARLAGLLVRFHVLPVQRERVFLGSQKVRAILELDAGGDEFASRSAIETRCQRRRDRHRLRHRRRDAVRIRLRLHRDQCGRSAHFRSSPTAFAGRV